MNDNSITEIESDTEIPAEIDPSQMTNFPDFEPQKLKELVMVMVLVKLYYFCWHAGQRRQVQARVQPWCSEWYLL